MWKRMIAQHSFWFLCLFVTLKPAFGSAECESDAVSLMQRTGKFSPKTLHEIQTSAHATQIDSLAASTNFPEVFVLIPGLGKESRVPYVRKNIDILRAELGSNFACSLVIYADGAETNPRFDRELFAPCKVQYNTDFLFSAVKAADLSGVKETGNILLLLDDIVLSRSALRTMRSLQFHNGHDVVSGSYHASWCPLMHPRDGHIAHPSTYVEFNAVLFNRKSFVCLQNSIDPIVNPMGYGYDNMYKALCSVNMVVCDSCIVQHMSTHESSGGLQGIHETYNHSKAYHMMRKWRAMLGQKAQGWDCCWEARGLKEPPENCQFQNFKRQA